MIIDMIVCCSLKRSLELAAHYHVGTIKMYILSLRGAKSAFLLSSHLRMLKTHLNYKEYCRVFVL